LILYTSYSMLRLAFLAAIVSNAASVNSVSPLINRLLRVARKLENEENVDYLWLTDYSIKFESCHTEKEYDVNDGQGSIYTQKLVKFNVCSSDKCSSNCKGGRYLVQLEDFVGAYADQKEADEEYACEKVMEQCYCENDDGGDCENNCYINYGVEYCIKYDDDGESVDIRNYLECQEIDMEEDDVNE